MNNLQILETWLNQNKDKLFDGKYTFLVDNLKNYRKGNEELHILMCESEEDRQYKEGVGVYFDSIELCTEIAKCLYGVVFHAYRNGEAVDISYCINCGHKFKEDVSDCCNTYKLQQWVVLPLKEREDTIIKEIKLTLSK